MVSLVNARMDILWKMVCSRSMAMDFGDGRWYAACASGVMARPQRIRIRITAVAFFIE
jgi:hypothetical protein